MLAIRKTEASAKTVSVDEIDEPGAPGPGEVLIKTAAAGICGTDMHIYNWGIFTDRIQLPRVLGHELSGIVAAVGAGVERVKLGDLVAVESHISCGACYPCRNNRANLCTQTRYPGIDINGGFAPYVILPEKIVMPLPPHIDRHVAALFEPFGIAVHASMEGSGVSGADVLITGCGPIGLMNVMVAKALGAHRVVAVDVNPLRLARAEQVGADVCINPTERDLVQTARGLTGAQGFDVMIEYSGAAASVAAATQVLCPGAELRLIGVPSGATAIELERWILHGLVVRGINGRRLYQSWDHALRLVGDGKVDLRPLISHVLPLSEGRRGFELIDSGDAVKVLFEPN